MVAWLEAHVICVLLQANGFQWSFVKQQVQHVPGFLPWMLFGRSPLFAQCVDLDVRLYYTVHAYGNVPQTTAEPRDTPLIHCNHHVQKDVDIFIQLPADLECDPVQMTEVVQQENVLVGGSWFYTRVTVANTVHL